jgi:hypothetical protein
LVFHPELGYVREAKWSHGILHRESAVRTGRV